MQHHLDDLDLLADVSGTDSKLLHLLTCPDCRSFAISRLLELSVEADEDGEMADYEPVFERLSQLDPVRLDDARARRAEAERLLQELMASPAEERLEALHNVCFHSADLLDLLLEQSHARQIQAPEQAAELSLLAAQLAAYLASADEEMAEPLVRALCLEVNALRLGGDLEQAEVLIEKAAVFTDSWEDRAFYCRTLALVRWEQARTAEAAALLEHAARVYGANGPPGERGVCLALLGLLAAEEERPAEALPLLFRGWSLMDRDLRPLVALRVALALAFCLAGAGQDEEARSILREAWRLVPEVRDPGEMVRVYWQEARVLALLGQREESRNVIESVLRMLAAEGSFGEAVLAALDLALVSEGGQLASIVSLVGSLEPPPGSCAAALNLGIQALETLEHCSEAGEAALEKAVKLTSDTLRRTFRTCGVALRPLPFA